MAEPADLRAIGEAIERLIEEVRAAVDDRSFEMVEDLVRLLTELYGAGLARTIELASAARPTEEAGHLRRALAADDLVASLLLIHDLHPDDLTTRVQHAVDDLMPAFAARDAQVREVAVDEASGAVRVALVSLGTGCGNTPESLRQLVLEAINGHAPDAASVEVEVTAQTVVSATPVQLRKKAAAGAGR